MASRAVELPAGTAFWRGRPVLVTGACGFIGSHLVDALLAAGAEVRALGRYNSRDDRGALSSNRHPALKVHLGDVADPWQVARLTAGVDTVFHLAALIGVPYSYLTSVQYLRTNVEGTLAVLEAARAAGVRRLVHTSTSEVYGSGRYLPMDELHPQTAQSPYAASKIAADKLAESYHLSFGTPVVTLRPFNTFGPRQSLRAVVPSLMLQAIAADEIEVGALDPVRDFTYVADTVAAFLAAGTVDGVEGEVFNIGSGVGHSVAELLVQVQAVAGTARPVRQSPARLRPPGSEVQQLVCDASKARARLGYAPSWTLSEGLQALLASLQAGPPIGEPSGYRV